jgi:hypothetical protein
MTASALPAHWRHEAAAQGALLAAILDYSAAHPDVPMDASTFFEQQGDDLMAGLEAYRRNSRANAAHALALAYPTVLALVGERALGALAAVLWRLHPPVGGDLARWGAELPSLLATHELTRDWPYLPDCARLDWIVHGLDLHPVSGPDIDSLHVLSRHDPGDVRLMLQPGLSVLASPWPVVDIYRAHHPSASDPFQGGAMELEAASRGELALGKAREAVARKQAQNAIIWRHGFTPRVQELPAADHAWMQMLADGVPLGAALERMAATHADFDFSQWLVGALQHGWLQGATADLPHDPSLQEATS